MKYCIHHLLYILFLSSVFFALPSNLVAKPYSIDMRHQNLDMKIGAPAIIAPNEMLPSFNISSDSKLLVQGSIKTYDRELFTLLDSKLLEPNDEVIIQLDNQNIQEGTYCVSFQITDNNDSVYHESFYFSILNSEKISGNHSLIVFPCSDGKLKYIPDYRGNRIPDYSTAGYKRGGIEIPEIPVELELGPKKGDDTERIQEAIDVVSAHHSGGAVLLTEGVYEISESLEIRNSDVVLRGEGQGDFRELWLEPSLDYTLDEFINSLQPVNATVLIATGEERRRLISIYGDNGILKSESTKSEIVDQYVPVGANSFRVKNPEMFSAGDRIILERTGNSEWISEIGMDQISELGEGRIVTQWSPFDIEFEHTIKSVKDDLIILEGTVFNAIEKKWGGGRIYKYCDEDRISEVGIENLRAISFWRKDEYGVDNTKHAHQFLNFSNTKDSWVKNVTTEHFFSINGAISIGRGSTQITISESSALLADDEYYSGSMYSGNAHVETGVYVGRYGFRIRGQNNLIVGCYTLNNRHSFSISSRVPGANVFLNCKGEGSLTWSGPHHKWSTGGLYDNVNDKLSFMNRLNMGGGHGWAGANYVAWNTNGILVCEQPPTAQNWAIDHGGKKEEGPFIDYSSEGYWEFTDYPLEPESLYLKQLEDRIGEEAIPEVDFFKFRSDIVDEKDIIINYPNPARNYTYFEYMLKEEMYIQLNVYTINGEFVSVVDQGYREEGNQKVYWEVVDNSGNKLPAGIYVYQLITDNGTYANKLLITQ